MSETITTPGERIDVPSKGKLNAWMNKLEETGVPVELECGRCGDLAEITVPADEADDETQKTLCRSCGREVLEGINRDRVSHRNGCRFEDN